MNEDTVMLLKECNSGCKMAVESIGQVLGYVKDDELGNVLRKYKEKHEALEDQSERLLMSDGKDGQAPGAMAATFSWISTEMKMLMKSDNNQIAKIMMDGCNMGIQSISEYKHQYQAAEKTAMELADELIRGEEAFGKELEKYL